MRFARVSDAPPWFTRATESPYDQYSIDVEGTDINVLSWGTRGKPGLVFVHGGAAHANWWSFIAPMFSSEWHAVAFDLSGHGDSGRRGEYSHHTWAEEVMAVSASSGFPGPPVVVGHSLGGMVTIQTAASHGDELRGAVIVDTPVRRPSPEEEEGRTGRAFRSPGVYTSREEAESHFRLIPPQDCENDYIIDWIAHHSIHETPAGWTWKFDPALFRGTLIPLRDQLASVRCRLALLTGDRSAIVTPDTARYMYDLMGRIAPVISIPEAHHHLTLDQPIAFVAALRTLLADWEHSVGHERA